MTRSIETLSRPEPVSSRNGHESAQSSLTVAQMDREVSRYDLQKELLGKLYFDMYTPRQEAQGDVLKVVHKAAAEVQDKADIELRFPTPPEALTPTLLKNIEGQDLQLMPVPAFPIENPEELQKILDQRQSHPIKAMFPEQYLREVLNGNVPILHRTGYYMAVDRQDPAVELEERLKLKNPEAASIQDAKSAISTRERRILKSVGVDPNAAYMRLVTAKESRIFHHNNGVNEQEATNTRIRGTQDHIVFDHGKMTTMDSREPGALPRLAVVFSSKPVGHVSYLRT